MYGINYQLIACMLVVLILGPRRYTNVFDESKINRIR